MNPRDTMMRTACALLVAHAGHAMALTETTAFTNNCASCHGVPSPAYDRPLVTLPSVGAAGNWNSAVNFKAYVNSKGTTHSVSAMTNLSQANADLIWPYMAKMVFGSLSQPESFTEDAADPLNTSINFGTVTVTTAANTGLVDRVVTLSNYHGTSLSYTITGVNTDSSQAFYVAAQTCSIGVAGSLPAGDSCTFTLRFKPRSGLTQSYSDTVNILTRDLSRTISLTGTGQERRLSVSTATLNMSAAANSTSTASRTLSNNGQLAVSLSSLSVSGTGFSQDASSTCGASLNAGASCDLVVRFAPTAEAGYPGTVSISHNGTNVGSPTGFSLNGTGTSAPVLNTSAALGFGDVVINTQSTQNITLSNTGVGTLNISGVATGGADAASFARNGGTCGSTLAEGANCTIGVRFSPTATRAYSATLNITSDASNGSPRSITLTGTGIPVPAPVVSLSASAVNFGTQTLGGLYPTRTVTLSNTGNAALAIGSLSSNSARFVLSHNCGASLAAAASCTLTLSYSPNAISASDTADISLSSNAAGSPHTIGLTGQAVAFAVPVLNLSPVGPADFGTVNAGQVSATQTFTVGNAGPGGAQLNLVHLVGSQASQFGITGASTCAPNAMLYQGENCTVVVQFNPAMPGNLQAQLEVTANTNGSLVTTTPVTVQGEALGGPTALIELSQTALRFDTTRVGSSSATDNVEVWNKGSGPMLVSAASVTGPYWVENGNCGAMPFQLAPGQHCTLKVGFRPDASGLREGALSITSTAANAGSATLRGEGQAAMSTSGGGAGSFSWGWLALLGSLAAARGVHQARRARRAH